MQAERLHFLYTAAGENAQEALECRLCGGVARIDFSGATYQAAEECCFCIRSVPVRVISPRCITTASGLRVRTRPAEYMKNERLN